MDALELDAIAALAAKGDQDVEKIGVARNFMRKDVVLMTEKQVAELRDQGESGALLADRLAKKAGVTILREKDLKDTVRVVCISKDQPFGHDGEPLVFRQEYDLPRHVANLMREKGQIHVIADPKAKEKAA